MDFQDWLSLYNGFENNWHIASDEHEKYNEFLQLKNIFKNFPIGFLRFNYITLNPNNFNHEKLFYETNREDD